MDNFYYKIIRFFEGIPLKIKTFIQRGKRGWAISDTWGFDYYLSKVIEEGLTHLKKHQSGHPGCYSLKKWNSILKQIIWTFKIAKNITEGNIIYIPLKDWTGEQYKIRQKICDNINKMYSDGIKMRTLNKKETERFEKGFNLFKENFFSLWD